MAAAASTPLRSASRRASPRADMTNEEKVLKLLQLASPARVTNSEIVSRTGVHPHAQVFQITKRLLLKGQINGRKIDRDWEFWVSPIGRQMMKVFPSEPSMPDVPMGSEPISLLSAVTFEKFAEAVMSSFYGVSLAKGTLPRVPKVFDFLSDDHMVVGDAKFYTLVGGERLPPAKFSIIAEHVWLLEKTKARDRFLVFGNDRRVPLRWLERFGELVSSVEFFFLGDDGQLEQLNARTLNRRSDRSRPSD